MTELRTAALDAAIRTHGHSTTHSEADVVRAAAAYLAFLSGEAAPVDSAYGATPGAPAAPKAPGRPRKAATTVESAASLTAPAGQAIAGATTGATALAAGTSAALTAPAAAAAASAPAQQAVAASVSSNLVAPPTTIQAAAESLKALVQDKSIGRGREVAVALLKAFEVEQLAQIPAAKLAEFKQRCDNAGKGAPAASAAHDPTGGLLG